MQEKICQYQGLTFDDVLLEPRYSDVVPAEVDVSTRLDPAHFLEHPPDQFAHGHGHRGGDGHCFGSRGGGGHNS